MISRQSPSCLASRRSRQHGAVLTVVLILLVVMSLLALTSLRGTLLEQRMSTSLSDRSLSFQAAEAALREGEAVAAGKPVTPASGCLNGICAIPDSTTVLTPVWLDATVWASAPAAVVNLGGVTATPQYIVELLAVNAPSSGVCINSGDISSVGCGVERRYRVTARSLAAGRAEVLLQSIIAVP